MHDKKFKEAVVQKDDTEDTIVVVKEDEKTEVRRGCACIVSSQRSKNIVCT